MELKIKEYVFFTKSYIYRYTLHISIMSFFWRCCFPSSRGAPESVVENKACIYKSRDPEGPRRVVVPIAFFRRRASEVYYDCSLQYTQARTYMCVRAYIAVRRAKSERLRDDECPMSHSFMVGSEPRASLDYVTARERARESIGTSSRALTRIGRRAVLGNAAA